jgi:hypothetical protein
MIKFSRINPPSDAKERAVPETYLTSSDMNMIAGLVDEVTLADYRQANSDATVLARLLVESFEAGTTGKEALRDVLRSHLGLSGRDGSPIIRGDGEGGAIPLATK